MITYQCIINLHDCTFNDKHTKPRFTESSSSLNSKMPYVVNCAYRSGLKATGIFVILLSQDGFKSNSPKKSSKKTFLKVNLKGRGKPFVELWKGISNQMIKYQLSHIGSSFKLGITNMTYNWMERYPLSY